jgi:hypothetical protein
MTDPEHREQPARWQHGNVRRYTMPGAAAPAISQTEGHSTGRLSAAITPIDERVYSIPGPETE